MKNAAFYVCRPISCAFAAVDDVNLNKDVNKFLFRFVECVFQMARYLSVGKLY